MENWINYRHILSYSLTFAVCMLAFLHSRVHSHIVRMVVLLNPFINVCLRIQSNWLRSNDSYACTWILHSYQTVKTNMNLSKMKAGLSEILLQLRSENVAKTYQNHTHKVFKSFAKHFSKLPNQAHTRPIF